MSLQLENRWREDTHHYVRWSHDSREVIRLYKPRLLQQFVLSPRCGHLKGNGGVKGAVRFALRLTNHYAYVARFDIRHYYESIDHRVMLAQCRHVSPDVFDVVQDYLCVPDRRSTGKGMVAGGAISPLLGGLYRRQRLRRSLASRGGAHRAAREVGARRLSRVVLRQCYRSTGLAARRW